MIQSTTLNGITMLNLECGKVNAMDLEFCQTVNQELIAFEGSTTNCLVIRSSTPKRVFSAGIDLKRILAEDTQYTRDYFPTLIELFERIYFCTKPTLAVVEGVAIAGGCIMASACRRRIVTESAAFGMPSSDLDVPIPRLARDILRSVAPQEVASQLHQGRLFSAAEVLECGMVSRIVDRQCLESEILAEVQRLADSEPQVPEVDTDLLQKYSVLDQEMIEAWCMPELRNRVAQYVQSL